MFQFYLDGILIENPKGWEEIKSTLRRDDAFNGVLLFQDAQLEYGGDGYDYIKTKLEDNFCNVIQLSIHEKCGDDYVELLRGNIFVSDVRLNERTCLATAKIEDNSFFARINNNKNIKTNPFTSKSKNGVDITAATNYTLDVYSVGANVLVRSNCESVRVDEAFRFLIAFMTDGEVGYTSTTFGTGGEWEGLTITTGYQLRTAGTGAFEQFSFQELFNEVKARIPIGFKINNPYTSPVVQIEALSSLYSTTEVHTFTDIDEIITSVDQTKLYANIRVGSSTIDDTVALPFPEDIDFLGFKEEEFYIQGECNIDTTLELMNDWVISSNVIQKVVNGDQGFDKDLFLINTTYTDASNGRTTNTDFLQVGDYYYNEALTNKETVIRYIGFVPNSLLSYLDVAGSGTFKAYLPANITHTATVAPDNDDYNPLALSAESYDISGAYNTATYRFTAPAGGVYTFNSNIKLTTTTGVGTVTAYFQAYLRLFNSSNVIQQIGDVIGGVVYGVRMFTATTFLSGIPYIGVGANATVNFTGSTSIVMRAGDYVVLRFSKVGTTGDVDYTINAGEAFTYLQCAENTLGGGVFETGDPSAYPTLVHEFQYPVTGTDFQTLAGSATGLVNFSMNGQKVRKAWIKEIIYDHTKGLANIKLITDKTTQNAT